MLPACCLDLAMDTVQGNKRPGGEQGAEGERSGEQRRGAKAAALLFCARQQPDASFAHRHAHALSARFASVFPLSPENTLNAHSTKPSTHGRFRSNSTDRRITTN
jgi:hypothetical protein